MRRHFSTDNFLNIDGMMITDLPYYKISYEKSREKSEEVRIRLKMRNLKEPLVVSLNKHVESVLVESNVS